MVFSKDLSIRVPYQLWIEKQRTQFNNVERRYGSFYFNHAEVFMKPRILHIEDDFATQALISAYLEPVIEVVGISTKEQFNQIDEDFNLIICDGHIPCWQNHFDDVVKRFSCCIVVYSGSEKDLLNALIAKGAMAAFEKDPDGTKRLVSFIKSLVNCS